jgi:hypothetical protein
MVPEYSVPNFFFSAASSPPIQLSLPLPWLPLPPSLRLTLAHVGPPSATLLTACSASAALLPPFPSPASASVQPFPPLPLVSWPLRPRPSLSPECPRRPPLLHFSVLLPNAAVASPRIHSFAALCFPLWFLFPLPCPQVLKVQIGMKVDDHVQLTSRRTSTVSVVYYQGGLFLGAVYFGRGRALSDWRRP